MNLLNKTYLSVALLLVTMMAKAQFVDVEWAEADTVPPCYSHSFDVGEEYLRNDYSFSMEYVETEEASQSEIERYKVDVDALAETFSVDAFMGVSRRRGCYDVSVYPFAKKDGKVVKLMSFKPVLSASQKLRPVLRKANGTAYADSSLLAEGRWVKIRVKSEGVYELTKSKLSSMGFANPDKVRLYGYNMPMLNEGKIEELPDDVVEIPLWRKANGSVLFYSCGTVKWTRKNASGVDFNHVNNPYSEYVYYFVTDAGDGAPAEFQTVDENAASMAEATTFAEHALVESDEFSFINTGRTFFEAYDYANGNRRNYSLNLPGTVGRVALTVRFAAAGSSSSTLNVSAGGKSLGTLSFSSLVDYLYARVVGRTFTLDGVSNNKLDVALTHTRASGVSGHLDYIRAGYERRLSLQGIDALPFTPLVNRDNKFVVAGATANTRVWRVSSPETTCELKGSLANDGAYHVGAKSAENGAAQERFVALNVNAVYPSPEVVGTIANQNLHAVSNVDLVIVVPSNGRLTAQAQRLADAHSAREGMRCLVVRADELYNEFSSGTPDATAYRRFMKMLYDRATTKADAPKNLLLFGDGVWDNRLVTTAMRGYSADDFLLCYESDNSVSHTDSYVFEEYFALLDDGEGVRPLREKLDIGVGRIPVTTVADAKAVVDKLIRYINNEEAGAWKNTICVLGDDGDNNLHMNDAEKVLSATESLYPDYRFRRIYWDAYNLENTSTGASFPGAYADINKQMDDGALIMNYTGHGAAYSLSHEKVLQRTDFEKWTSPRLPLWVTAACDVSPFDMNEENIGESALLNNKGAAMGVVTTTRTVYSTQNRVLNTAFMKHVLGKTDEGRRITLGEALQYAKNSIVAKSMSSRDSINKCHFVLLGDPAITLPTPTYKVKVDAFAGKEAGTDTGVEISAGHVVSVKGRIVDADGNVVPSFNGVISPTVFDNLERVVCKNGANADISEPMVYYERLRTIYMGTDSVRNGMFEFSFPVPLDINYSDESGLLKLYAVSDDRVTEAHGDYDNFVVGGTNADLQTDTIGPRINLYLNNDSFVSGGKVNETPLLVAEISDSDGINTTGSGVGHDIIAIIDNDASMTYSLNSYFTQVPGDYTRGRVVFRLPKLPVGKHALMFRAWDVMNNSSVQTVEFEVVEGLSPTLFDLICQSPVRTTAAFSIVTDRLCDVLDAKVEVFDITGRKVANLDSQTVTSNSNVYNFTWDLASSNAHLQPGIYICRAIVTDGNGGRATKTKKFIVLAK